MVVPAEYAINKYVQHAGYARFRKFRKAYEACCPICREGDSWGKKRRSNLYLETLRVHCFNCGWNGSIIDWVKTVCDMSFQEVKEEIKNCDYNVLPVNTEPPKIQAVANKSLPDDCINLFDTAQLEYFKDEIIVKTALKYIKQRRLDTAINKPKSFWLSLSDYTHKNRIVIPFYENGKVIWYQSRGLEDDDKPKYMSKAGSTRTLFNIDNIDNEYEYIFIFEGPIDSMFVKNGVAVAGINESKDHTLTDKQEQQLKKFFAHKKIWVLDSQWQDKASRVKSAFLVEAGETVFIWPEKLGKAFKDFNDVCIAGKRDSIESRFVLDNSFSGMSAEIRLKLIP